MNTQVNLVVIPQELFNKMESDLNELKELIRIKDESEIKDQWIESTKIPKLLGICRKTWQSYRDKKLVPFIQIGAKIFVKRSDLENFMNSHYVSKRREI